MLLLIDVFSFSTQFTGLLLEVLSSKYLPSCLCGTILLSCQIYFRDDTGVMFATFLGFWAIFVWLQMQKRVKIFCD